MKKSLILVGMLVVGYANAQEGNVGINTETPKATLEIVPNATNLAGTTNEGIIIPKLTKARVVAIVADKLVEGTKVYVTDEVTAADTQFIGAGKGFYFYNGAKWIKQLTSDGDAANDAIWVKDGADARLNYPKSDYTTKYTEKGGYELIPADTKYTVISSTNSRLSEDGDIQVSNSFNRNLIRNSDIDLKNPSSDFNVEHKVVIIDADNTPDGGNGHFHQTIIPQGKNVLSGKFIRSLFVNTEHFGDAKIRTIEGIYGSAAVNGLNSSATNVRGGFFDAVSNSNADIDNMRGLMGRVRLNGTGKINSIYGIQSQITLRDGSTDTISSNIGTLAGLYIGYNNLGNARYTGTIDKVYDIYAEAAGNQGLRNRTKEAYGFYIGGGHKTNFVAGKLGVGTSTPIAKLDVVNGSARIAGKYFHKTSTSASIPANTKEIITVRDVITDYQGTVTDAGTELQTYRTYEIQLNAQANAHHVDSRYIVFYDNIEKQWKSKVVSSNGTNSIVLAIAPSGNQIEVWHTRADVTNVIRASIVSTDTNADLGASLYSFGLDGAMTNLGGNVGVGTEAPTEKLDVDGKIKATSLAGTGNRNVYADENGVLQVGSSADAEAGKIASTNAMQCNAENRGKMNFIPNDNGSDVFGICLRNQDGNYYWGYLVGGGNIFNGTGAFGNGL